MRILIADDSQLILRILQSSLQAEDIELVPVRDGAKALAEMESDNPPAIAIVDWQMPEKNGLEVCRRVRLNANPNRPYFILLSASADRQDQIDALNAGADSFISKPLDRELLLARVRAAMRIMKHQQALLAELARTKAAQPAAATAGDSAASPEAVPGSGVVITKILSQLCAPEDVQGMVGRTLCDMGFGEPTLVTERAEIDAMRAEIDLVHFMILPEKSLWLDLLLETNLASAGALFQTFTGMDSSDVPLADLVDSIGETLNMMQGSLKAHFKAKGADLLVPLVPQAIPSERVEARCSPSAVYSRSLHRIENMLFRFTLFAYPSPLQRKHLMEIGRSDVLAEALRPADDSDIVLINRGTLLTNRYLKKVENLAELAPRNYTTPVFEPSPLTALLPEG